MNEVVYDYVDEVNPNLVCAICHNPFIDPVTTSSCKHTFCKSCIIQSLTHRRLCPIDRSQIDQSTLQDAGPVVRNELKVRCISDGCDYEGQRGLMVGHTNVCAKRTITCRNDGCGQEIVRAELADHRAYECKGRKVRCGTCNDLLVYHSAFSTHVHYISPDPACGCKSNHPQDIHRWSCPEAEIPCDNVHLGCTTMVQRSQLSCHLETCVIEKIAPRIREQDAMVADLKERLERLEQHNRIHAQPQASTFRPPVASFRPSRTLQDLHDLMDRIGISHEEDQRGAIGIERSLTPPDMADELRGHRQRLERILNRGDANASSRRARLERILNRGDTDDSSRRTGEGISGITNRQRLEQLFDFRDTDDISPRTSYSDMTPSDSAIDIQQSDTLESSTADTGEGAAPDQAGSSEAARMSIDTISFSTSIPIGDPLQGQNAQRPAAPTWAHFMGLFDLVRDLTDQTSRLERAQQAQALSGALRLQEEVAELRGMVNVLRPHVLGGGQNASLPTTPRVPSFDNHSGTSTLSESITEEAEGDDETLSLRESIAFSSQHADPDHDSETSSIQSMVTANRSIHRRNRWGGGLGQPMGIPPELGEGTATVRVTVQRPSEEVVRGDRVLRPRNSVLNRFISRTPRNARASGSGLEARADRAWI